jgi:hypothetical protein
MPAAVSGMALRRYPKMVTQCLWNNQSTGAWLPPDLRQGVVQ